MKCWRIRKEREEKDKLEYYVSEVQNLNHTYGFEGSDDFVLLPKKEKSIERVHMLRQMEKDLALLGMPETELNHVICLDDESMDISLPRQMNIRYGMRKQISGRQK